MLPIIGIVTIFIMVFGGYILAGGKMSLIIAALPFEMMMIGGAAVGAFLISNGGPVLKGALGGMKQVFSGPKWKKDDYRDLLTLLFILTKTMKTKGLIALEQHLDKPHDSAIFQKFPKIMHDHFALDFICDTLRMVSMSMDDPHQVADAMERLLKKHHHEALKPGDALQSMADGTPALGIVAAVLGVIKTMASIDQPPAVLGKLIGGALVGTFLGVFLAYGFIGPFAARYRQIVDEDGQFYAVIRDAIISHLNGNAPQVSVEVARGNVPSPIQPSFAELDEVLNATAV
ncbi:flagellar motor stator protein MotA [Arenibaculum pallidiluteum]|uniref:flagellar motor stator protein MotA n=1 Tax=Arenibaculum pallidiluteum TaxID=2812559 RepID=UPI001A97677F|nr:flagellar motor stator protein MotA [Arenibaculum pallidiluteum]